MIELNEYVTQVLDEIALGTCNGDKERAKKGFHITAKSCSVKFEIEAIIKEDKNKENKVGFLVGVFSGKLQENINDESISKNKITFEIPTCFREVKPNFHCS